MPSQAGWIEVICGGMFSGKTEELIRRARRAHIAGQKVIIVKPAVDNRYNDQKRGISHAPVKYRDRSDENNNKD